MGQLLAALRRKWVSPRAARDLLTPVGAVGRRAVQRAVQHLDGRTTEPALAAYFDCYMAAREDSATTRKLGKHDKGLLAAGFVASHPFQTLCAGVAMARLPRYRARLRPTPDGHAVRAALKTRTLGVVPMRSIGAAVLQIPAQEGEYRLGASRQTLRRKIRSAEKRGVTWRLVTSPEERRELLTLVDRSESEHPDQRYRREDPDNRDLLDHDLWLVAEASGEPLLISVTPTDGEWASLRCFRTLASSPVHSDARYYALAQVVDQLGARGVRHLVDGTPPTNLTNGLRHYQRMVGFRYARVAIRRA